MRGSYFRTIFVKLLLLAALPATLFSAFFLLENYRVGQAHFKGATRQLRTTLSDSAKEGLLTGQVHHYLDPLTDSALLQPGIIAVVFSDDKGKVLLCRAKGKDVPFRKAFQSFKASAQQTQSGEIDVNGKRYYYSSGPVKAWRLQNSEQLFGLEKTHTEVVVGRVTVFAYPGMLFTALKTRLIQSLFALGILLVLVFLVALTIAGSITRPVEELVRGFRALEAGDEPPEIPDPHDRELKVLTNQFRRSTRRIRDLIKEKDSYSEQLLATASELEELNAGLEDKVRERTQSLRNAVEMLELSNTKIQEADRLKSEFLANMSHELRTPLNAVIGFSELLLERIPGPVTPDQESCLNDILNAGRHLLKLINEILDLSKVEAGKMKLNLSTRKVRDILTDIQTLFRPILSRKNQRLEVTIDDPDRKVYSDQDKLAQILINLLNNAHKFSDNDSTIRVTAGSDGENNWFAVRDKGIGIPKDHVSKIFEAFHQVDSTMARKQEGTGLGLALCRRFSHLMGGTITVESIEGEGATFTLRLPLDPTQATLNPETEEQANGNDACG